VSPTVLNERLRELRESGLLDSAGADGYGLTPLGRELIEQMMPLVAWSARWAAAVTRGRGTPRSSR
jgi:DNA-binding HxlR family transcriptional regulator